MVSIGGSDLSTAVKRMQKDAKDEELGKKIREGDEEKHGEMRRGKAWMENQSECAMQHLFVP